MSQRCRLRDLGISVGKYPTGIHNAITDVPGVLVGHSTIRSESEKSIARTGVTAVLPNHRHVFYKRVSAGSFILNGAGEMSGLIQVQEWGMIETPILLSNTFAVGKCSDATVRHLAKRYPEIGHSHDVVIPLVGECDDSWLNDIGGQHVRSSHVISAIASASDGAVAEGSVGGGTGMVTADFKAGIGTSSRQVSIDDTPFHLGILVMSNFGVMRDLRLNGFPLGAEI